MATETIAGPRPALVVALGLAGLGVLAVVTLVPVSQSHGNRGDYSSFFFGGLAAGVAIAVLGAAATARISGRRGSAVVLVNFLTISIVPVEAVDAVESWNGVSIRTRDGREVDSFAYGSSALQEFLPSARYRLAGRKLEDFVDAGRSRGTSVMWMQSTRLRAYWTLAAPCVLVALQLYVFLLWLAAPTLYRFVAA